MNLEEFQTKLRASEHPVVVDIWAPWCAPCRALSPRLAQVGESYAGQVEVWKVNSDEEPELARALRIMGIPTLLFYRNGQEVARRTGVQSVEVLQQMFDTLLQDDAPVASPGLSDATRWLRLLVGFALLVIAALTGWAPLLLIAGGLIIFSGIYDRCPIWKAITSRLRGASQTPANG